MSPPSTARSGIRGRPPFGLGWWQGNSGPIASLNRALHTIVMTREAWHAPTKRYVARRTAQGKSQREIRRCLARAVARGLYRLLEHPPTAAGPVLGAG